MQLNTELQGGLGLWVVKRRGENYQSSGQSTCLGLAACVLCECVLVSKARAFCLQFPSARTRGLSQSCSLMHSAGWKHWNHASFIPIQHSFGLVVSNSLNLLAKGALQAVQKHLEILFFPAICQYINAPDTLLPGWQWHLGACSGRGSCILQKSVTLLFENATDLKKSNLLTQAGGVNYSTKSLYDIRSRKSGRVPCGHHHGDRRQILHQLLHWSVSAKKTGQNAGEGAM